MQLFIQEQESDMLKAPDQDWVRRQIADAREAITNEIRTATQRPEVQGFKKFIQWLRDWSLVGTSLTLFVGLLAVALAAGYYAFSRVDKQARFEQSTVDRLNAIETLLHDIQRSRISQLLDSAVSDAKAGQEENANEHLRQVADTLQGFIKESRPGPRTLL